MPNWSRSPIPTLLRDARRLYTNIKGDAEIAAQMALYKYPESRIDEGLTLVADVEEDSQTYGAEKADATQATGQVQAATTDVETAYTGDREMARTAYARGSDGYQALGLRGDAPDARAAIFAAAKDFYGTLQARPDLIEPIPGLTPDAVTERLAAVTAAETADVAQAAEGGEAEVASDERKEAVAALREHASKTARVAKGALKDRPQLREKLGLLERS